MGYKLDVKKTKTRHIYSVPPSCVSARVCWAEGGGVRWGVVSGGGMSAGGKE